MTKKPISNDFHLIDLVVPVIEKLPISVTSEAREAIKNRFLMFIENKITYAEIARDFSTNLLLTMLLQKLCAIKNTENEKPLKSIKDDRGWGAKVGKNPKKRKEPIPWSEYEDNRLFMALHIFGTNFWYNISAIVGNGRTRSQCMQRWCRVLDPRISKKKWTTEEDEQLCALVALNGESWLQIASIMGNRSDVQCRYRYKQLKSGKQPFEPIQHEYSNEDPMWGDLNNIANDGLHQNPPQPGRIPIIAQEVPDQRFVFNEDWDSGLSKNESGTLSGLLCFQEMFMEG